MTALILANAAVVTLAVALHYEALLALNALLPRLPLNGRLRILFGVLGALVAHAAEVWLFAAAYYGMHHGAGWGTLGGAFGGSLLDCVYFSFSTYTTLGFGDIAPTGGMRFLTGIEALTGLVLITWTASFLYLEMTRLWPARRH